MNIHMKNVNILTQRRGFQDCMVGRFLISVCKLAIGYFVKNLHIHLNYC